MDISLDILLALDILVLERKKTSKTLSVLGGIPKWVKQIYPEIISSDNINFDLSYSTFLANFILDAEQCWQGPTGKSCHSGIWCEKDPKHTDFCLEATALKLDHRKLLVVRSSQDHHLEKAAVLQTARDEKLKYTMARKEAMNELIEATFYDRLTALPNQSLLMMQLTESLQHNPEHNTPGTVLLLINLDRFQLINQTFTPLIGDQLLIEVAARLKELLRSGDLVARIHGDEFAVLIDNDAEQGQIETMAHRILTAISLPFNIQGQAIRLGASIGIAKAVAETQVAADLVRDATAALKQAKASGKGKYVFFHRQMHAHSVRLLQLELDLNRAIEEKEFETYYQPLISVENGRVSGFEALIRWNHPTQGLVMPSDFIRLAEETGQIIAIDHWMLHQACLSYQQHQFNEAFPITLNLNLSAKHLHRPDLLNCIQGILNETKFDPTLLKLEITEGIFLDQTDQIIETLQYLKSLGIKLSIDDFGTGYSSLGYLQKLPIDQIKIDRCFIQEMEAEGVDIVRTIIDLTHRMGLEVTAEGIETNEQYLQLKELNCDYVQGYLFSKPVGIGEAVSLIKKRFEAQEPNTAGNYILNQLNVAS